MCRSARLRETLDADRCQPHGETSVLVDRQVHNDLWNAASRLADILDEDKAPRTNTRQFCARCRAVDRVGFMAPKELWRLVAGPRWEHDILCLACFAEIGDEKGIKWDVPELAFYPVSYVTLAAHRDSVDTYDPWLDDRKDLVG